MLTGQNINAGKNTRKLALPLHQNKTQPQHSLHTLGHVRVELLFVGRHASDLPRQHPVPEQSRAKPAKGSVQRAAGLRTPQQGRGLLSGEVRFPRSQKSDFKTLYFDLYDCHQPDSKYKRIQGLSEYFDSLMKVLTNILVSLRVKLLRK